MWNDMFLRNIEMHHKIKVIIWYPELQCSNKLSQMLLIFYKSILDIRQKNGSNVWDDDWVTWKCVKRKVAVVRSTWLRIFIIDEYSSIATRYSRLPLSFSVGNTTRIFRNINMTMSCFDNLYFNIFKVIYSEWNIT